MKELEINRDRIGVIWGAGIGGLETFQTEILNYAAGDGTPRFNPFFIPKMIADIAPGQISIKYGFRGPNFATVSACASSSNAIIDASKVILKAGSKIIINLPANIDLPKVILEGDASIENLFGVFGTQSFYSSYLKRE